MDIIKLKEMQVALAQRAALLKKNAEKRKWEEMMRLTLCRSDEPTSLYEVWNSKLNHYFVLARDEKDALAILEKAGHVVSRKLARIKKADAGSWAPSMGKFFASTTRASADKAQGIVKEQNGFAVMRNNGMIYMPLSVVG
jgi:hypothetical protein